MNSDMTLDHNGMEVLSREECLVLLSTTPVGRVGLTVGALPVILPVNFAVSAGDDIVFRTGEGQKLRAALDGAVIAFEADGLDAERQEGWSVLVQGVARLTATGDGPDLPGLELAELATWAGIEPSHVVMVNTEHMSGRRIVHLHPSAPPAAVRG